ncbi:MAG: T9SS type A sorting domain-containing protein [Ferruginibacter sp.]
MKQKTHLTGKLFYRFVVAVIFLMLPAIMNAQTRTNWEMHAGNGPEAVSPCSATYGAVSEYAYAVIPNVGDPGWGAAPNASSIGFAGPSDLCNLFSCLCGVDFTYFQTFVNIPGNVVVSTFTLTFSGVDDGARVTIYNSVHPTGLVVAGSYVFLGGTTTADLAAYMVSGEVNRVVVTHVDDCCSFRSLNGNIVLNGEVINPSSGQIVAKKFYDANVDGIKQGGEQDIANWAMTLDPGAVLQYTDGTGSTTFGPLTNGNYTVTEGTLSGWLPTNLSSRNISITTPNQIITESFGNVCLGGGGAYSKGYWGNKNGEATLNSCTGGMAGAMAALTALNLRNANGTAFDPATYTAYKNWSQAATGTNMAYMLSAQMAAMKLNMRCAGVSGTMIIYAPGTGSANAFGFASVGSVMTEADNLLSTNGSIPDDGSPLRILATALKDALDKGDNNLNFVQPAPCSNNSFAPTTVSKDEMLENKTLSFKVWPNPATGYFSVSLMDSKSNERVEINVFDVNGKPVYSNKGAANQTYRLGAGFQPGIYSIHISQGEKTAIQKLVKE